MLSASSAPLHDRAEDVRRMTALRVRAPPSAKLALAAWTEPASAASRRHATRTGANHASDPRRLRSPKRGGMARALRLWRKRCGVCDGIRTRTFQVGNLLPLPIGLHHCIYLNAQNLYDLDPSPAPDDSSYRGGTVLRWPLLRTGGLREQACATSAVALTSRERSRVVDVTRDWSMSSAGAAWTQR